jgi:hypothetical protein
VQLVAVKQLAREFVGEEGVPGGGADVDGAHTHELS